MAMWGKQSIPEKKSPPDIIRPSDGVNKYTNAFDIDRNEAFDARNTSNVHYPALSPRAGLTSVYGSATTNLSGVNGATARAGETFHVVEGTTWKYWNGSAYVNVATSLTDAQAKFLEFTTATDKYTIMFNGTDKKAWNGSAITNLTQAPNTRLITANDNRMFALKDSSIYASDIGDITNWTTDDSDRIGLYGMKGSGTAIIVYNDMIIGFSDQTMHIVFGKTSDEFDPTEPISTGCLSDKTVLIHGDTGLLHWLDYNRVMAFTGGLPYEVSKKVRPYLEDINYTYKDIIIMGQSGRRLYISFPYKLSTTNNLTLEYDTERDLWYPWDIGFTEFFNIGENLYGITSGGIVYKMNQGTQDDSQNIEWYHIMGVSDWKPIKNLKHITDMYAIVDLPEGSTLSLEYSTSIDNDDFKELYMFISNSNEQNTRIRIPTTKLQRINWYRLKLSGTGFCKVHYLEVHGRVGN